MFWFIVLNEVNTDSVHVRNKWCCACEPWGVQCDDKHLRTSVSVIVFAPDIRPCVTAAATSPLNGLKQPVTISSLMDFSPCPLDWWHAMSHECHWGCVTCGAGGVCVWWLLTPLTLTLLLSSSSDHQLTRHGGRHLQEAGEGTRLLCDRRGRGEDGELMRADVWCKSFKSLQAQWRKKNYIVCGPQLHNVTEGW